MAYSKKLATIVVTTIDGGSFTASDTVSDSSASNALTSLQRNSGAYVQSEGNLFWVPATAVANIKVSYADSEPIEPSDKC